MEYIFDENNRLFGTKPELMRTGISWKRFVENKLAMTGLVILSIVMALCFGLPALMKGSFVAQNSALASLKPSWDYPMGTDPLGRNLALRVCIGGQASLLVGFVGTFIATLIGLLYGLFSGYCGGLVDRLLMRIVECVYTVPIALVMLLMMAAFGRGLGVLFIALGGIQWMSMARIVRARVLEIQKEPYVEYARCMGLGHFQIIIRHILPNLMGSVIVWSSLTLPYIMLLEVFFSYIGMGIQPPMTSWGMLIRDGAHWMEAYPWVLLFPCGLFALTLFSINCISDALRDILDPKLSTQI